MSHTAAFGELLSEVIDHCAVLAQAKGQNKGTWHNLQCFRPYCCIYYQQWMHNIPW